MTSDLISRLEGLTEPCRELSFFDRHAGKIAADPNTGCWLWTGAWNDRGFPAPAKAPYGVIFKDGARFRAHRMAYEAANGPIPEGLLVRHKCDVSICVNPDHLVLGTHQDNSNDKMSRGRGVAPPRPPKNVRRPELACQNSGHAKLGQKDVDAIRAMRRAGVSCQATADVFGVSKSQVSRIARGLRWLDGKSETPEGGAP